jgi:hypothetical protein
MDLDRVGNGLFLGKEERDARRGHRRTTLVRRPFSRPTTMVVNTGAGQLRVDNGIRSVCCFFPPISRRWPFPTTKSAVGGMMRDDIRTFGGRNGHIATTRHCIQDFVYLAEVSIVQFATQH